ncbi:Clr5 domain-containing protein [Biscogniauxia sp. FL1348]|nr:Clr5 domain-containing protein [Biscogniauxia sp. FL1348]
MGSTLAHTGFALAGDWARFRDTITTLYLEQNKPLREVKRIMKEEHYFFATDKMYKTHFKKWGLQKNLKHDQVGKILAEKSRRAAMGKSTKAYIHGRQVGEDRLNTYLRRVPPTRRKSIEATASAPSQQEVREDGVLVCRTPSPGPPQVKSIPRRLEAPDTLKATEDSIYLLRAYVAGSSGSDHWSLPLPEKSKGIPDLHYYWNTIFHVAMASFRAGLTSQGFGILSLSFQRYQKLLQLQHPLLIIDTCLAFSQLSAVVGANKDLLGHFIYYAFEMSRIICGPGHPICSFFSTIRRAGLAGLPSFIATLMRYYFQAAQMADRLDAELVAGLRSAMELCELGHPATTPTNIHTILGKYKAARGHPGSRLIQTLQGQTGCIDCSRFRFYKSVGLVQAGSWSESLDFQLNLDCNRIMRICPQCDGTTSRGT